ncbi:uncharacterized protein PHALS_09399 [Plasmopara halstedii]|uniref:Uncharacterized protein n=1 Tax=Plasmopara halstedii TaxID=4781 RepID=A0A0P1A5A9_PLAHL|nr:uncharacterized protein PHALS_09399 [Plasmopara halstedii]CEG35272.1 hypothetical protein PHALS_09399 [Plasmopara halstedii]|eukprot:XP_024571641.1 hypothetical protein PHALS_09399 [Plasmopara halstedii]
MAVIKKGPISSGLQIPELTGSSVTDYELISFSDYIKCVKIMCRKSPDDSILGSTRACA